MGLARTSVVAEGREFGHPGAGRAAPAEAGGLRRNRKAESERDVLKLGSK